MKRNFLIVVFCWCCMVVTYAHSANNAKNEPVTDDTHATTNLANHSTSHIYISQQLNTTSIHFRLNKYDIDPNYMNNADALKHLAHVIDSVGIEYIDSVVIRTQSSPDGTLKYNLRLSKQRAQSIRNYIDTNHPEVSSRVISHSDGESWDQLRECIKNDKSLKEKTKEKFIAIIDADVNIDTKKWRMKQQPEYRYLISTWYPLIRNSSTCFIYHSKIKSDAPATEVLKPQIKEIAVQAPTKPSTICNIASSSLTPADVWTRHLYLKTNLAAWGLAISNVAAEVDLAPHWSLSVPIYYSAWNYAQPTLKFRTFAIIPEARYWLNSKNEGVFFGAHAGFIYYNFAFNGDYRYQDHNGTSPAWGGGINVGYRIALDRPQRWHLELALGGGVYDLYYDTFHNVENGRLDNTYHDTYWGIDHVGITISYRLPLDKKGGKR